MPWEDVDLAVLDRVVDASGGARRVERAFVTALTRVPRWIVRRKDVSERRYDVSVRRVSR